MQKKSILVAIIIFLQLFPCYSRSKYIDFGVFLSSGYNFHTDGDLAKGHLLYNNPDAKRILAGLNTDATFHITEPLSFFVGADSFADFNFLDEYYYHTVDFAFYAGIKLFPFFHGLNCSISYALGSRLDFVNISTQISEEEIQTISGSEIKSWGNGFRIAAEYDFLYETDAKICPVAGFCYRFMPRGNNNYDNILTAYVGLRF